MTNNSSKHTGQQPLHIEDMNPPSYQGCKVNYAPYENIENAVLLEDT